MDIDELARRTKAAPTSNRLHVENHGVTHEVHLGSRPSFRLVHVAAIVAAAVPIPLVLFLGREEVTCGAVVSIDQASLTVVRAFSRHFRSMGP